eukprot:COSAG01_NODE_52318_length_347_cov_1.032258_1_plen_82_part_10
MTPSVTLHPRSMLFALVLFLPCLGPAAAAAPLSSACASAMEAACGSASYPPGSRDSSAALRCQACLGHAQHALRRAGCLPAE